MASIRKRGKSYLIQVSMPDGQGGYLRKSSTYTPPPGSTPTQAKRGADKHAIEFEDLCKGLLSYDENMTLDKLHAWYMSDIAPQRLKNNTMEVSAQMFDSYIRPVLGQYKLKHLTPVVLDRAFTQIKANGCARKYYMLNDVDEFKDAIFAVGGTYNKMGASGVLSSGGLTRLARGGRATKETAQKIADFCQKPLDSLFTQAESEPLAPGTLRRIQSTLGALLSAATQKGIIRLNPMLNAEPIKAVEIDRPVMDMEQARLFLSRLEKLDNISVRALLVTALFTGLRSGELRALQWPDIDTQRGLISVNKGLDNAKSVTTPKTKSSTRIVQIDIRLAVFLEQYYNEQQAYIAAMRGRVADNGIVFPAKTTGKYMHKAVPNKVIETIICDTGIPQDLHLHSLRHTFTSILINNGADLKKVQSALGHAKSSTTLDIYSHIFAETLARSMEGVSLSLTDGDSIFGDI